jgi:ADP-heptose:LPS heptosyltransferase
MTKFRVWQEIDRFVGSAFCFFLAIVRSIFVSVGMLPFPEFPKSINKILYIKMVGFGSIVLATPAINAMRKKYPHAKTYILTLEQNRPVVELMDEFDEILTIDHSVGVLSAFRNCFKVLFLTRKLKFDIIFDLEILSRMSSIFVFLCGSVFSVGFGSFYVYRDVFYNSIVSFDHSQHMKDIYLKMVSILGVEIKEKKTTNFSLIPEEVELRVHEEMSLYDYDKRPIIFVNINSGELTFLRRLPLDKMRRLLTEICKKREDVQLAFIGSPSEKPFVEEFFKTLPPEVAERSMNFAGRMNIAELLAAFKLGALYFGNDSGPLHLAAAVGLPTVAFFGPETPNLYGYNESPHRMFYTNYFCSPCLNSFNFKHSSCKLNSCLIEIEEEPTVDAVVEIISQTNNQETQKKRFDSRASNLESL